MTASSPRPSFLVSLRPVRVALVAAFVALLAVSLAPRVEAAVTNPFVATFGSFSNARGVGADDAGNVYVIDNFAGTLSKYDSAGNPVDFSALGSNVIAPPFGFSGDPQVAVDRSGGVTGGDIYVAAAGRVQIFGADGTSKGVIDQADGDGFTEACGVAVGPTGTLYVADFGGGINRYIPTASPATNADYDAQITGVSDPCEIAVDSTGAVYVAGYPNGPLTKFAASQFGGAGSPTQIAASANAVAVDPNTEDVYVSRSSNDVAVYDSSGNLLREIGAGQVGTPPLGVAVAGTGHVFVANGSSGTVSIFGPPVVVPDVTTDPATDIAANEATFNGTVNPDGVAVTDCHFEYGLDTNYGQTVPCAETVGSGSAPVAVSADLSGVDSGIYHFRLVAANADGTTNGSDRTVAIPGAPAISDQTATLITSTAATLRAKINPGVQATTYHFEYVDDAEYQANGFANAVRAPEPDASLNAVAADVPVSQQAGGLEPSTTYHFRVVATNPTDTVEGPDTTFTTPSGPQPPDSCPNAEFRSAPSLALPDCRAYEQVSPVDKAHTDIGLFQIATASPDGNAASFATFTPLPGGTTGPLISSYAAARGSSGWDTFSINPLSGTQSSQFQNQPYVYGGSDDYTKLMVFGHDALAPGAEEGATNLYSFDTQAGTYELVATASDPHAFAGIQYAGGASDGSNYVFSLNDALDSTPAPPPGADRNVYEWSSDDGLQLVGILPDGTVNPDRSILPAQRSDGINIAQGLHTVSDDGSRIFWTEPGGDISFPDGGARPVYLREGDETKVVTRDQADVVRPGIFRYATPDGSQAFITSRSRLTADASPNVNEQQEITVGGGATGGTFTLAFTRGANLETTAPLAHDASAADLQSALEALPNLAPGDVDVTGPASGPWTVTFIGDLVGANLDEMTSDGSALTPSGTVTVQTLVNGAPSADLYSYDAAADEITNLTPTTDPAGAQVLGVFGASDDGDYVYFLARGALAPGATAGEPNIYVSQQGQPTRFIGALASDATDITANDNAIVNDFGTRWRVSPDGLGFGLTFRGAISGPNPQPDQPYAQAYYYAFAADSLDCASCPDGSPTGPATFFQGTASPTASGVGQLTNSQNLGAAHPERLAVTNGGRLFFNSPDALLARDTNGASGCRDLSDPTNPDPERTNALLACQDVYEYVGGERHLLSTGTSEGPTAFGAASKSGDDVFLVTYERLAGQDRDNSVDLYDARVGGGLASQNPPAPDPPCQGDSCQDPPTSPPEAPGAGSNSFRGAGNVKKAPRAAISSIRRLSASARTALGKGRRARLSLRVNGPGTVTLAGTARISKKNRRVVSASAKAKKAGSVSISFALSKSARAELRSKRRLTVRLAVRFKDARPKVVSVTLKAPTSKKGGRS